MKSVAGFFLRLIGQIAGAPDRDCISPFLRTLAKIMEDPCNASVALHDAVRIGLKVLADHGRAELSEMIRRELQPCAFVSLVAPVGANVPPEVFGVCCNE